MDKETESVVENVEETNEIELTKKKLLLLEPFICLVENYSLVLMKWKN